MNEPKLVAIIFNPNGDGFVCTELLEGLVDIRLEGTTTFWSITGKKYLGEWKVGNARKLYTSLLAGEVLVVLKSVEKPVVLQAVADAVLKAIEV